MTSGEARLLSGRYRIGDLLGRGGMSEVYHGYDERLDRPVAIKMLRQPTGDVPDDSVEALELLDARRRDRARFLREIRTAARLEHPGTPAVYDTGVDEQAGGTDRIWLVMQLLRGSTLDTVMTTEYAEKLPEIAWAAAVGAQLAAVLADLHGVDVVHRDIKPANVMLVDGGLVKVLDFGIAILRGPARCRGSPRSTRPSAPRPTCPPSSTSAGPSRQLRTSTPSVACSTSCSAGTHRSSPRRACRGGPTTCRHPSRPCAPRDPTCPNRSRRSSRR